jgi:hypothetical protein
MNSTVIIRERPVSSFLRFSELDNLSFPSSLQLFAIDISSLNEVSNASHSSSTSFDIGLSQLLMGSYGSSIKS